MSNLVRKAVSKNKRRLKEDGFDLDLSYITPRLIAMGFPSESMEGVYRNPFKEVFRFLELKHKDRYKVYNLCSERGYDVSKFHNRVECFPFDDHNAPPLQMVLDFCKNTSDWLQKNPENVAVIHCKAGKGRTGVMICAYLLYSKEWATASDAMSFYAAMRTYNKKGVTIPSQIRYIHYFGSVVQSGSQMPQLKPVLLKNIQFQTVPKVQHFTDIRFSVYVLKTLVYTFKDNPKLRSNKFLPSNRTSKNKSQLATVSSTEGSPPRDSSFPEDGDTPEYLIFECPPIPICGDIKMEFYEKETFGSDQKLFAFWFNTSFAVEDPHNPGSFSVEIGKEGLDKANKDKQCKTFRENFKVICNFQALEPNDGKSSPPTAEIGDLVIDEAKRRSSADEGEKSVLLAPLTDKYPSLKSF